MTEPSTRPRSHHSPVLIALALVVGASVFAPAATRAADEVLASIEVTITNSGSHPAVIWGDTVTVRVTFTERGENRPFELQQTTREMTTWSKLADLVTDANGVATFSWRPSVTTRVRAVFAGAPDLPAGVSDTPGFLLLSYAKQVPANATPRVVRRGTTVTLTTTARPILPELAPAVVQFRIYHRVDGSWKQASVRRVTVDASGVARLPLRFGGGGEWYVRSVVEARWAGEPETAPAVAWASRPTPIARFSVR